MSTISSKQPFVVVDPAAHPEMALLATPTHQAYRILQAGFVALPIVAGLDKFADRLVHWTQYLAPVFPGMLHISKQLFMYGVGAVEIIAGLLVAVIPRIGAYVVMLWLWGIIVNLALLGDYHDVALRDLGLSLGALALGRLASAYHQARRASSPGLAPA